jgi:hypothetical protein
MRNRKKPHFRFSYSRSLNSVLPRSALCESHSNHHLPRTSAYWSARFFATYQRVIFILVSRAQQPAGTGLRLNSATWELPVFDLVTKRVSYPSWASRGRCRDESCMKRWKEPWIYQAYPHAQQEQSSWHDVTTQKLRMRKLHDSLD